MVQMLALCLLALGTLQGVIADIGLKLSSYPSLIYRSDIIKYDDFKNLALYKEIVKNNHQMIIAFKDSAFFDGQNWTYNHDQMKEDHQAVVWETGSVKVWAGKKEQFSTDANYQLKDFHAFNFDPKTKLVTHFLAKGCKNEIKVEYIKNNYYVLSDFKEPFKPFICKNPYL